LVLQTRKKRMDWKALEIVKPDAGGTLRRTLPRLEGNWCENIAPD